MPSPTCTVKDGAGAAQATTDGVNVTAGNTITIQLADIAVNTWSCTIVGQDDQVTKPTLTTDNVAKTVTFTAPAAPWALIFESRVNGGKEVNGQTQTSYTTTFGIYVLDGAGHRLFASNERSEGSSAYGWITKLNALSSSAVSSAWTPHAMGAAPLVLTDTTNAIVNATTANGQQLTLMKPAFVGQRVRLNIQDASLTSGDITVTADATSTIQIGAAAGVASVTVSKTAGANVVQANDGAVVEFQAASLTQWKVIQ